MKNIRYAILIILGTLTALCTMAESEDEMALIISKLIALVLGYLTYRLYNYWHKKGLLPENK